MEILWDDRTIPLKKKKKRKEKFYMCKTCTNHYVCEKKKKIKVRKYRPKFSVILFLSNFRFYLKKFQTFDVRNKCMIQQRLFCIF